MQQKRRFPTCKVVNKGATQRVLLVLASHQLDFINHLMNALPNRDTRNTLIEAQTHKHQSARCTETGGAASKSSKGAPKHQLTTHQQFKHTGYLLVSHICTTMLAWDKPSYAASPDNSLQPVPVRHHSEPPALPARWPAKL